MLTCPWLCPGVSHIGVTAEPSLAMWDRLSMPKPAGSAYSDRESGVEENRDGLDRSSIHDRSCKKKRKQKTVNKKKGKIKGKKRTRLCMMHLR